MPLSYKKRKSDCRLEIKMGEVYDEIVSTLSEHFWYRGYMGRTNVKIQSNYKIEFSGTYIDQYDKKFRRT